MTKAILVIDLTDNLNKEIDEIRVDIKARIYGKELKAVGKPIKEICKLKPMPRQRLPFDDYDEFALGWNACIREILKEDKEQNV